MARRVQGEAAFKENVRLQGAPREILPVGRVVLRLLDGETLEKMQGVRMQFVGAARQDRRRWRAKLQRAGRKSVQE